MSKGHVQIEITGAPVEEHGVWRSLLDFQTRLEEAGIECTIKTDLTSASILSLAMTVAKLSKIRELGGKQ